MEKSSNTVTTMQSLVSKETMSVEVVIFAQSLNELLLFNNFQFVIINQFLFFKE